MMSLPCQGPAPGASASHARLQTVRWRCRTRGAFASICEICGKISLLGGGGGGGAAGWSVRRAAWDGEDCDATPCNVGRWATWDGGQRGTVGNVGRWATRDGGGARARRLWSGVARATGGFGAVARGQPNAASDIDPWNVRRGAAWVGRCGAPPRGAPIFLAPGRLGGSWRFTLCCVHEARAASPASSPGRYAARRAWPPADHLDKPHQRSTTQVRCNGGGPVFNVATGPGSDVARQRWFGCGRADGRVWCNGEARGDTPWNVGRWRWASLAPVVRGWAGR